MIDNEEIEWQEIEYVFDEPWKHKIWVEVTDNIWEVSKKFIDIFVEKSFPMFLIYTLLLMLILIFLLLYTFLRYKKKHPFKNSIITTTDKLIKKVRKKSKI